MAVSDTPAGRYTFLGYVHDADGGILGEREGDDPQFDPGCYCENGIPYLYSGCSFSDTSRGASVVRLEADMVTMASEPVFIVPGKPTAAGTAYEGHAFFEASSMRKVNDTYYFIYSSELSHELCYATGPSPMGPFTYRGTIISNIDLGIAGYKPAGKPMGYPDNNHGSIEQINGRWYVFYHRHTNASSYSRQACLEPLEILEDGTIPQVEMTTSGPNGKPLEGEGFYSAHKACVIHYTDDVHPTVPGVRKDAQLPYFTQDEPDGVICEGHIENMLDGAMAGFKYFACTDTAITSVKVRGYCVSGGLEVRTNLSEEPIGIMPVGINNEWKTYEGYVRIPDGVQALYFTFKGFGRISFAGFTLTKKPEEHQKFCKE